MSNLDYYNNIIPNNVQSGELVRLLWKKFNIQGNSKPSASIGEEQLLYLDSIYTKSLLNKEIPQTIKVDLASGSTKNLIFTKEDANDMNINVNMSPYIDSDNNISIGQPTNTGTNARGLIRIFIDNNIPPGYKLALNQLNSNLNHLEFVYRKQLYRTFTGLNYTWWATDPSGKSVSTLNTIIGGKSLLQNTIPRNYDNGNNKTYNYILEYYSGNDPGTSNFINSSFIKVSYFSQSDYWTIDVNTGYIIFLGGTPDGDNIRLTNFCSEEDWTTTSKSPPFFSFIRYVGDIGFTNVDLSGLITVFGDLSVNNQILSTNALINDLSINNNLYIENNLTICGEIFAEDVTIYGNLIVEGSFIRVDVQDEFVRNSIFTIGSISGEEGITASMEFDVGIDLNYYKDPYNKNAFFGKLNHFDHSSGESEQTQYYDKFVLLDNVDICYNKNLIKITSDPSLSFGDLVLNNLQALNQIEVSNNLIISSTGNYNISNSSNNLLIGNDISINDSSYSIVVGSDLVKNKNSDYSVAIGKNSVFNVNSPHSFAFGLESVHIHNSPYSFAFGSITQNISDSSYSFSFGNGAYNTSSPYCFSFGYNCYNSNSNNSLAFGNTNTYNTGSNYSLALGNSNVYNNSSQYSLAFGNSNVYNDNSSNNSFAFGNNYVYNDNSSNNSFAFGSYVNSSNSPYCIAFGNNVNNSDVSYSYLFGKNLTNSLSSHSFITGKYNLDLSNVSFAIGNGSGGVRSNLLTVFNEAVMILGEDNYNYPSADLSYSLIIGNNNDLVNNINNTIILGNNITTYDVSNSLIIGDTNQIQQANNTLIIGNNNSVGVNDNVISISNSSGCVLSPNLFLNGSNNSSIQSTNCMAIGTNIALKGYIQKQPNYCYAFGTNITFDCKYSEGYYSINNCYAFGNDISVNPDANTSNCYLFGNNLTCLKQTNCMVIGKFNDYDKSNTLFVIANGTDDASRNNLLEVYNSNSPHQLVLDGSMHIIGDIYCNNLNTTSSLESNSISINNNAIIGHNLNLGTHTRLIVGRFNTLNNADLFQVAYGSSDISTNNCFTVDVDGISTFNNIENTHSELFSVHGEFSSSTKLYTNDIFRLKINNTNYINSIGSAISNINGWKTSIIINNTNSNWDNWVGGLAFVPINSSNNRITGLNIFTLRPEGGLDNHEITSFTGQHRISFNNIVNKNNINDYIGLIACSTDNFFNLNNEIDPTINESLPICELSSKENQKSVYGVISNAEDDNLIAKFHMIAMTVSKTNLNENRISVNSLGEGALWICNSNGNLENGDYISSSIIPGYGQKQTLNEGILCNFTVAKITGNCDFNLTKNVKKKVKTLIGASGEKLLDFDENNLIQYIDDLDENGNQQLVYKYDTRFIDLQGNILKDSDGNNLELTQEELDLRISNGEQINVACFVGCTYHCG